MPATPKAKAKAKGAARIRPRGKAKAVRQSQVDRVNARQKLRRDALSRLNALATEVGYTAQALVLHTADNAVVEQRVRALQRRCHSNDLHQRLHAAAKLYLDNGGRFSVDLVEQPTPDETDLSPVAKHKVLRGDFRLQSSAFMLTYHSSEFTEARWLPFRDFVKTMVKRLGCRAWSACIERGTTPQTRDKHHFHAYLYWQDGVGVDLRSTDVLVFDTVRPRVDQRTKCSGLAARSAAHHGLWYVAVMKLGTVAADTNFEAWRDYTPLISWVDGLWAAQKLGHEEYLSTCRAIGTGYAARKRDASEVMRDELEASICVHDKREQASLQRQPSRPFPDVERFVALFAGAAQWRRPMLVFVAATNMGKSLLARRTLERVADALGLPGYAEVTVEGDAHLDMSGYDHRKDAGVLLDGVGDALFLKRQREVLQGQPKKCLGGKSATMKFAYPFTLSRRAVVVTMDLSADNLGLLETDHWLSDPKNVMVVKLTERAWMDGTASAAPATIRCPQRTVSQRAEAEGGHGRPRPGLLPRVDRAHHGRIRCSSGGAWSSRAHGRGRLHAGWRFPRPHATRDSCGLAP